MQPENLLPYSQELATRPYPETDISSLNPILRFMLILSYNLHLRLSRP
jgi:hypothetical protein